jgi:hypothetical protein
MKKILMLMVIFGLVLTNCKKDKGGNGNALFYDVGVGVSYRDKSGNDLLDPNSKSGYYEKDIHIYQVKNGVKSEYVPAGNLDQSQHIDQYGNIQKISRDTLNHCYAIGVGFLYSRVNGSIIDTVLIELNKNTVDTVTGIVEDGGGGTRVSKVWYNRELKWQIPAFPFITIVK